MIHSANLEHFKIERICGNGVGVWLRVAKGGYGVGTPWLPAMAILAACGSKGTGERDGGPADTDSATRDADGGEGAGTETDGDAGAVPDGGSSEDVELGILGLVVEPNPRNALSCLVRWTTGAPATSEVRFGPGELTHRVRQDGETRDHRVLVIGLRGSTAYRFRVVSESGGVVDSAEITWTSGVLPDIVPFPELTTADPAASTGGWTLTNVSGGVAPYPPAVAVMYDEEGQPVWYYIDGVDPDERGDIDVRLLPGGNVLIGPTQTLAPVEVDLAGNVVWVGPPQEEDAVNPMSHHLDRLDNGNYLTLREVPNETWTVHGTLVEEFTSDLDVVWQWNILDHVVVEDERVPDWCHGNSATVDHREEVLYLSCRNLELLFKASLTDGRLLWRLGADGDFGIQPPGSGAWFGQLHDPEIQPNGNILVYDNGDITGGAAAADLRSRVVEYALDEGAMTATLVWEFPGDSSELDPWYKDGWFTPIWGDADRLENGNTLITAGTRSPGEQSRIFEVTPEGRVVWEIKLPLKGGHGVGVYRAQRIPVPPLIARL